MLEEIENRTRAEHPGLAVRSTLAGGGAASSLVELSRGASLVVVGRRGTGGFPGLLVGSVGAQVAMYGHAPVIVVRQRDDHTDDHTGDPTDDDTGHGPSDPGPVVVGVDGSASTQDVLAFAFEEATHRCSPACCWGR